jgi:hypothetical protein
MRPIQIWTPEDPSLILREPEKILAVYIDEKLLLYTRQHLSNYFWISSWNQDGATRIKSNESFHAYLYAAACETEQELEHFIPLLKNYDEQPQRIKSWRDVLKDLKDYISFHADYTKIKGENVIVAIYNDQIINFIESSPYHFAINGIEIADSPDKMKLLLSALICESEADLLILEPLLNSQIPDWKFKVKRIQKSLEETGKKVNLFKRIIKKIQNLKDCLSI